MKNYINNILKELIEDEVNIDKEWTKIQKSICKNQRATNNIFRLQFLKYVAAILIGIVTSMSTIYLVNKEEGNILANYKLVTGKGEKSLIQLPDGSKVWLNACTTIEYTIDYGKTNRNIKLNGEAYFEVAKDKNRPFIVKADNIEVKALGTAFDISAYPEDSYLSTTLYNGKVSVKPSMTKQEVLLEPNQVAVYYKDHKRIEVQTNDINQAAEWRGGSLSFDMMSLEDITKKLERNYDVVFRYNNQDIKDLKFSGSFRDNENLSIILDIIKTNTGIEYDINEDTIVIK